MLIEAVCEAFRLVTLEVVAAWRVLMEPVREVTELDVVRFRTPTFVLTLWTDAVTTLMFVCKFASAVYQSSE